MTQTPATKKTTVKKTTQKKRLLNKLPATLPAYNYESFSYKDMQRAVTYFQAELSKIEKLLSKLPSIGSKSIQPNSEGYVDIEGKYRDKIIRPTQYAEPTVKLPPTSFKPYTPGMEGDWIDMPNILGGMAPKAEIVQPTLIEDNSAELSSELSNLLNNAG